MVYVHYSLKKFVRHFHLITSPNLNLEWCGFLQCIYVATESMQFNLWLQNLQGLIELMRNIWSIVPLGQGDIIYNQCTYAIFISTTCTRIHYYSFTLKIILLLVKVHITLDFNYLKKTVCRYRALYQITDISIQIRDQMLYIYKDQFSLLINIWTFSCVWLTGHGYQAPYTGVIYLSLYNVKLAYKCNAHKDIIRCTN